MINNKFLPLLVLGAVLIFAVLFFSWKVQENSLSSLTVSDLLENPEQYSGQLVEVSGYVQKVHCISTLMYCPPENPCCNSVTCSLALVEDSNTVSGNSKIYLISDSEILKCTGDNCNVSCSLEPGNYTLQGKFVVSDGEYFFEVEQIL